MKTFKYCIYEPSEPALLADDEAWAFRVDGGDLNIADAAMNSYAVSKDVFDKTFGKLPALPSTAFGGS
jgi:hypothetical protein